MNFDAWRTCPCGVLKHVSEDKFYRCQKCRNARRLARLQQAQMIEEEV